MNSIDLTIITINAALFGILIAFLSAYAVYFKSVLSEQTNELINEAEKINDIYFMRSCYFPEKGFGQWPQNINAAIEMEREKLSIDRKKESEISELGPLNNADDIKELGRYLHFLSNPIWSIEEKDDRYDIGNNKFIPRDLANRGEEIMRTLNIFSRSYLFPEPPFETPGAFFQRQPKRIYFKNVGEVKSWLLDLEAFILVMKQYKYSTYHMPSSEAINQLKERDSKLIESWETSKSHITFGNLDPDRIKTDFLEQVSNIESIAESTRYTLNKIENINSTIPSYSLFGYIFIALSILFISGVYAPLAFPIIPRLVYFHLPMVSYLVLCIFVLIRLFR